MRDSPYTNPDFLLALYEDPENAVLLAEFALATGAQQLGLQPAGAGGLNGAGVVGDPGTTGTGGPCFAGETLFTLFNGVQIPMAELYENRAEYIGKGARSFTHDNIIVPGPIVDVFKTTVYEALHVTFKGESVPMRMSQMHRFWVSRHEFVAMRDIQKRWRIFQFDEDYAWSFTTVAERKMVEYPDGIDIYNASIGTYRCYFAAAPDGIPKAVSNNKFQPPGGDPEA